MLTAFNLQPSFKLTPPRSKQYTLAHDPNRTQNSPWLKESESAHIRIDTKYNLYGSIPNSYYLLDPQNHATSFGELHFQKHQSHKGCTVTDVLKVLIDRMQYLQCGVHASNNNKIALQYLELASQLLKD